VTRSSRPTHGSSCARLIRDQARAHGGSGWEIARAVSEHCGLGLLRAHRFANEWTLVEVTERLRSLLREAGQPYEGLAHQRVSCWETGVEVPSQRYMDALCRLYRTRPDRLGFGCDYSEHTEQLASGRTVSRFSEARGQAAVSDGHDEDKEAMERRELLRLLASYSGLGILGPLSEALSSVRMRADTLLETQSVSIASLDAWEALPHDYGRLQFTTPAHTFLAQVLRDFAELRNVLSRRQPLDVQMRLYRVMAQLAGLIAISMNDVSDARESRAWLHTARLAADETGDRLLRAWIVAREAMLYLWYGRPVARAVELTRAAQAMAGPAPSVSAALAVSMEARALARLGRRREALASVNRAEAIFDRLSSVETEPSMLGFDVHRLRWCQQNALTTLGETKIAISFQNEAKQLSEIDLALIQLDRASCYIQDGHLDEGCRVATRTFLGLPAESRRGLVHFRANAISAMLPPGNQRLESVQDLKEALLCRPNTRSWA
jgi:tetratricopeptide (TPR) repeat protein